MLIYSRRVRSKESLVGELWLRCIGSSVMESVLVIVFKYLLLLLNLLVIVIIVSY
jgi:hypothetical protein